MEKQIVKRRQQHALTPEWKQAYLDCLRATGSVMRACSEASPGAEGSAYNTFHDAAKRDPEFAREVEMAKACYREVILSALHRLGIEGELVPQFSAKTGKQMVDSEGKPAFVRKYSDEALRLATRRRSLWSDEFAISTKSDSTVHTTTDSCPRLDLTRGEIFALPESDRRALAVILRKVSAMRGENAPEQVEAQAQELLEHGVSEGEFEEIPESTSPKEEWEDLA